MRRWFIAFLALVMVSQLSWATMALCCLNEIPGKAASSSSSVMQMLAADEQGDLPASGEVTHTCDAGHCHCHHAAVAAGRETRLELGGLVRTVPAARLTAPGESHIPEGLDRPNWQRA